MERYYFANYSIKVIMIIELKSRHQKKGSKHLENCRIACYRFSLLSGIYFQMSSVTCSSLDHSKFWFFGNGLNGCELKSRN